MLKKKNNKKPYGLEVVLDLKECDTELFTKVKINNFFNEICQQTKMKRHGKPMYWEDWTKRPHLRGISAVQFIETSQIVCHCLELLRAVYIDIFTCKQFNVNKIKKFTKNYWRAERIKSTVIVRT